MYKRYNSRNLPDALPMPGDLTFSVEADWWTSFKHYLMYMLVWPWYDYLLIILIFTVVMLSGSLTSNLITLAVLVGILIALAAYTASMYKRMADRDVLILMNEDGVHFCEQVGETDEDGKISVQTTTSSVWSEVQSICVYRHFMVIKLIPTSKLRLLFISCYFDDENLHKAVVDGVLSLWKTFRKDQPYSNRRILWIVLAIVYILMRHRHLLLGLLG